MAAATNIEKGGAVSIDGKVRLGSGTDERSGCQMKVCVVGAGAIGGLLAVKLSFAGNAVYVVDRGAHLAAIKGKGLQLRWHDGAVWKSNVKAFDKAAEAGKQDLVVLAVKAYDLEAATQDIEHLFGPDTIVITVQNGMPWWYFQREGGNFDGRRLETLDPRGILSSSIDADRIMGCVAYPAAAIASPGVIEHVEGDRFPVGELDGRETKRVKMISDALSEAGLKSRVISDIRAEIWLKAWGSLTFNPISALSHATMAGICRFPETRRLAVAMMTEAQAIASKLGITFRHTIDQRIEGAEKVGEHKTSMLQDLEAGKPLEYEALVGAILEMGRLTATPTPVIESVYALIKLLDHGTQAIAAEKATTAASIAA
jgi:ketopantoate reductase